MPGYGGYSYYTTCMLDTDSVGRIMYRDTYDALPDGNNVAALDIAGSPVDFTDAATFYRVSTVNYLAAGACNFSQGGASLWPLDQIVADTQFYVRDAVIEYVQAQTDPIAPAVEGRLLFGDTENPVVTIDSPAAMSYLHSADVSVDFSATDTPSGVLGITALVDGSMAVVDGQALDLHALTLGDHTLVVRAVDWYGNEGTTSVTFTITTSVDSLISSVEQLYESGDISKAGVANSLIAKLERVFANLDKGRTAAAMNGLAAFINEVTAQSGKAISPSAAALLIADAESLIAQE